MRKFFTADTHFSHERILEITDRYRDFSSIADHDDRIVDAINATVGRDDELYVLGDFCWRAEESWASKLKCRRIHLIFGNHDKAKLGKIFKTAEDTTIVKIADGPTQREVFCSHYPHAYWPKSHYGSLHLYGHVHAERETTLDAAFPGRKSTDAGVDNAKILLGEYRPFSQDDVFDILLPRPGHDFVEWYDEQRKKRRGERDKVPAMLMNENILNRQAAERFRENLNAVNEGKQLLPPTEQFYDKAMEVSAEIKGSETTAKELAKRLSEQFRRNNQYDI